MPNLPVAPIISGISPTTFTVSTGNDGNPIGTFYSFRVITNGIINYVTSAGILSSANMYNNLQTITVVNIAPSSQFLLSASAATDAQGSNATAYGPSVTFVTLPAQLAQAGPFTPQQQQIIEQSRLLMPQKFSVNCGDERILAFAEVVLADINLFPPLQGFTTDTLTPAALPLLYFGISLMAELFFQMSATLQDFNYNDNGLSLNIDQTGKIAQSYQNMLEFYRHMITNFKKTQIFAQGAFGISSPRYQSQIGQFLKISLGSSFNWNSPS